MGESPQLRSYRIPGERIAHYEILEEIGRGGMGVVFRARDLKLGRRVALKRPLPDGPDDRRRRQILREARAAARLSHPHIVPIFEVLEEQGVPWLAMDFVDGTTLRAAMASRRPLPLHEALRHGEGLASALHVAHAQGILHRDVKPTNVMITSDGRAVLTDFGLAEFVRASEESSTRSGQGSREGGRVAGTLPYMSPEQALGRPVDGRSDVFSLGAVLYEMCTGQPAFGGEDDVLDAVLNRHPVPPSRLNQEVPEELDRIIKKALAKDADERYQDARDLVVDLRSLRRRVDHAAYGERHEGAVPSPWRGRSRWLAVASIGIAIGLAIWQVILKTGPPPAIEKARVGVLAVQDLTGRPDAADWPPLVQAIFVEELTSAGDLAVVDPLTLNAIMQASSNAEEPRAPLYSRFRELDLAYVVDGTLRTVTDGYWIQTNVIQPGNAEVRFSADVTIRNEKMLPEAVAGLARRVLTFLHPKVLAASEDRDLRPFVSRRPRNLEALKAFVQATEYMLQYQRGARKHLQRAIDLDPTFISPRIWLISSLVGNHQTEAATEHYRYLQSIEASASAFDQALIGWAGAKISGDYSAQAAHLEIALEYSPGNSILLVSLAGTRFRRDDFAGGLAALEGPLRLKWRFPPLYTLQAACLMGLGRFDDAKRALTNALPVAAVDPDLFGLLAALSWRDDEPEAAEQYRDLYTARRRELGAGAAAIEEGLSAHLLRVGLHDRAIVALRAAVAAGPENPQLLDFLTQTAYKSEKITHPYARYARTLTVGLQPANGNLALGRIADARGEHEQSREHYQRFLSIESDGPAAAGVMKRLASIGKPEVK